MRSAVLAGTSLAAALLVTMAAVPTASAVDLPKYCPQEQYRPTDEDLQTYYCGYKELGPLTLPTTGPVGALLKDYDRLGGLTPDQFLKWYRDGLNWKYPYNHGFKNHDDKIEMQLVTVKKGTELDRFGPEEGNFLSTAGTPYAKRGLPPDSLNDIGGNDSYHCYQVLEEFPVQEGPGAAAFAQPGGGTQQWLDKDHEPEGWDKNDRYQVSMLLKKNYLQEVPDEQCSPG
jgi:hypothetical protein